MLPYALWLIWIIPILGAVLIAAIGPLHKKLPKTIAAIVGAITAIYSISTIPDVLIFQEMHEQFAWIPIPSLNLNFGVFGDPLSIFMANIASLIGFLIIIYSCGYMTHDKSQTRYFSLVVLFIGAMTGLVLADNFLQLFIFWEVVGVCSYALIGFWYDRPAAARAGMKAFVVTRIGDVCLLIGIIFMFTQTGTFEFLQIQEAVQLGQIALSSLSVISLFTFGGAMGKSAQVPFHVWLPDAMQGPSPVSALIHAATMVKAGIYLVGRTFVLFQSVEIWLNTVMYVGAITALLAATMALVSNDLKGVLAYSTISQLGLIMTALGVGTTFGWFAGQSQVMSHALFKALLFLCAGSVMHATNSLDITKMGGLRHKMPFTFITSLIGVFALSGLPPFNGFWSKDLIFAAAWNIGALIPLILAWTASVLTVAYSFRWMILVFFGPPRDKPIHDNAHESPVIMVLPLAILGIAVCLSGLLIPFGQLATFLEYHHLFEIELIPLLLSLSALTIGAVPVIFVYVLKKPSSQRISKNGFAASIQKIWTNGYYFDAAYDKIFVRGTLRVFNTIFSKFEIGALDKSHYVLAPKFIHESEKAGEIIDDRGFGRLNMLLARLAIASSRASQFFDKKIVDGAINGVALLGQKASRSLRRLQTGITENYIAAFVIGILLLIIVLLIQVLW